MLLNSDPPFAPLNKGGWGDLNVAQIVQNGIITLSLGVASLIPDGSNGETDLIAQADRALYEAKNQGRNRVVVSEQ
ncbi:MAG: GGDEF domain-containing protein [Halothece sp.]